MLQESVPDLEKVLSIGSIIGEGTFSTVYKGKLLPEYQVPGKNFDLAIKCITPVVEPQMLENELKCLTLLNGEHNVIKLLFATRHYGRLCLVMPFYDYEKFNRLVRRFNAKSLKEYMRQLLIAVNHIHQHQIIHRDIKPNNFLYSSRTKHCALVDFGLAQTVDQCNASVKQKTDPEMRLPLEDLTIMNVNDCNSNSRLSLCDKPKKRKSQELINAKRCNCYGHARVCRECIGTPAMVASRSGTAGYRPPEVLLKCQEQTTAVDMWACGIILLSILSGRSNFFNAPDDLKNLMQLISLFGKEAVCQAATALGKNLIVDLQSKEKPASLKVNLYSSKSKNTKQKQVRYFPGPSTYTVNWLTCSNRISVCHLTMVA